MRITGAPREVHDYEASAARFERYLKDQRLEPGTVALYRANALKYLRYVHTDRPTSQNWDGFRAYLQARQLSRSTLNQYANAARAYHAMINTTIIIKQLEPHNDIPYYFDEDDILKIFSACEDVLEYTMFTTMFYSCLRVSELIRLDSQDVDISSLKLLFMVMATAWRRFLSIRA